MEFGVQPYLLRSRGEASLKYRAYAKAFERDHKLGLKLASARAFAGLESLLTDGFLVVSEKYRNWVVANGPAATSNGGTGRVATQNYRGSVG